MKIQECDYKRLEAIITPILDANPTAKDTAKFKGYSATRFYWDLWHFAVSTMQKKNVESYLFMRGLHDKLNDSHIETAMKRIAGPY
jgi:hypothetical protein